MDTITTPFPGADSPLPIVWLRMEYDPRLNQGPTLIAFCGPKLGRRPNYTVLKTPRGCVVVLRSWAGRATLYESTSGSNYM
jgi:hypothetical protein